MYESDRAVAATKAARVVIISWKIKQRATNNKTNHLHNHYINFLLCVRVNVVWIDVYGFSIMK